jgi:hypothetical protein
VSAPPHSVAAGPAGLDGDRFGERNNFLLFLLGLISTSERILQLAPGLAPDAPPGPAVGAAPAAGAPGSGAGGANGEASVLR